jgi:hypothetical protein
MMRKTLLSSTKLVVPSRNRAAWLMGRTNHTLKYVSHLNPELFVRDDDPQLELYRKYAREYNATLKLQPSKGCFGVSKAYDMIINAAIQEGFEQLLILDDDMQFKMWNPILGVKPYIKRIEGDVLTEMFCQWTYLLCAQMPIICLLPIARRTQDALIRYSAPVMWCYGFYLPHFKAHPEHRFFQGDEIEARCDISLGLNVNQAGFLTSYLCSLIIPNEVNNPGGCSSYRTLEVEERATDAMTKKFPGIVCEKMSKGWGPKNPDLMRRSVAVAWKKAFNAVKFYEHFNEHASTFKRRVLLKYEDVYSKFIEELRNGS